ncbi:conserved hypothetical protein [Alkaliphilus metalliredigens QYMF]|uniref:t-SNARE coiled-coil homology domain-containing protein n=1 Tax=Alkaliphilus metalliredigens (strain QYMF) TaxID=293826 RepID=A6TJW0_ALKMQ|nr:hypothetical protein [Alkaliphilus metalliredigens]ABR46478.1 conserved hypothetical protein [Alkaliphilus metalliredigens QYMF]
MDDKLFQLMEKMYSEMQEGFKKVNTKLDSVESRMSSVEFRMDKVEKTVLNMEDSHGKKLDVLFDGYKQNSEKLDRIEEEVNKHEEVIIRKIK